MAVYLYLNWKFVFVIEIWKSNVFVFEFGRVVFDPKLFPTCVFGPKTDIVRHELRDGRAEECNDLAKKYL